MAMIVSQLPKIKKPPGGFQARFFWEPSGICKTLSDNNMQNKKTQKREKVQNKMLFFRAHPPVSLPKRPKTGPFLLSVRFSKAAEALLGIDGE
jgi:hypothetical protein